MKKGRLIGVAVVIAVVTTALLSLSNRSGAAGALDAPPDEAKLAAPSSIAIEKRQTVRLPGAVSESPSDRAEDAPTEPEAQRRLLSANALELYRKNSRFPPNSRPLSWTDSDLIYPNARHESRRRSEDDEDIEFLFTADRYFVMGSEPLSASLEVWRRGARIAPTIVNAQLQVVEPTVGEPVPVPFQVENDVGLSVITPAQLVEGPHALLVAFEVAFEIEGTVQRSSFNFQFTPPVSVPAVFSGEFSGEIVDGSLVVAVGVAVTRPGYYIVDANLWAGDEPVAWTRFKGELSAGATELELEFFGKAIVESELDGPYRLGELRGSRFDEARAPDMDHMPSLAPEFETEAFKFTDFADEEYDSEFKQRKLEALERATLDPNGAAPGMGAPPTP
ncbi:MAG: hypothetical protein AAFX94_11045 [Myxococcota bacterium]